MNEELVTTSEPQLDPDEGREPVPPPPPEHGPILPPPEPEPVAPEPEPEPRRQGRARLWGTALALAVLAGLGVRAWQVHDGTRDDLRRVEAAIARREEALAAASGFAVTLTSYDYRRIAEDVAKVAANAVGKFKDDYAVASGPQFQQLVKTNKATSTGKVLSAGVVRDDGRQVVVLLAVDQTVTNVTRPRPSTDRNRIQLTLEKEGDRWYVVDVAVL